MAGGRLLIHLLLCSVGVPSCIQVVFTVATNFVTDTDPVCLGLRTSDFPGTFHDFRTRLELLRDTTWGTKPLSGCQPRQWGTANVGLLLSRYPASGCQPLQCGTATGGLLLMPRYPASRTEHLPGSLPHRYETISFLT